MTDPTNAANSLDAADSAQQRALADVSWFPWACLLLGLVVIPGGIVVPWGLPARLYVVGFTFAVILAFAWFIGRMRAAPRGGKNALNISVGCWFVLNAVIGALGSTVQSLGLGMALSVVASTPFFIAAAKFHSGPKVA